MADSDTGVTVTDLDRGATLPSWAPPGSSAPAAAAERGEGGEGGFRTGAGGPRRGRAAGGADGPRHGRHSPGSRVRVSSCAAGVAAMVAVSEEVPP
jgi:hypothetical protein